MRVLSLLFILAFLNLSWAAQPLNLTPLIPIVAISMAIILALLSSVSTSTANPVLTAWVKTEIRELIAGVILVVAIGGIIYGTFALAPLLSGDSNYLTSSQKAIEKWLLRYDVIFEQIIRAASKIRAAASYSPYLNIPIWYVSINYSTNPIAGIAMILGPLNLTAQAVTNGIFLYEAMLLFVSFFKVTIPSIILPLSFVMRLIPFTRRIGNTLISLCIGVLVLFPFSILLAENLNGVINLPEPKISNLDSLDANPWAMVVAEPFCDTIPIRILLSLTDALFAAIVCLPLLLAGITAAAYPACYQLVQNVVYPLINLVVQLSNTTLLTMWEAYFAAGGGAEYARSVFDQLYPFLKTSSHWIFVGYIDFLLIVIITITGVRSISSALGGEWYMAGVQRLI